MITRIVAFLPNPWFPAGTPKELIHRYKTIQEYHQEILGTTMDGYRLKQALGDDMFARIWWDNVAPEAADNPRGVTPVDMRHVEAIIAVKNPHLILTFGTVAKQTIERCAGCIDRHVMSAPHPNNRHIPQSDLDAFGFQVWDWVNLHDRKDEFTKHDKE